MVIIVSMQLYVVDYNFCLNKENGVFELGIVFNPSLNVLLLHEVRQMISWLITILQISRVITY